MSRILCTYGKRHRCDIFADDCERHYCGEHRMLWRDCDNATPWTEGDRDVINGTRIVWEPGQDCPACVEEIKTREYDRLKAKWEAQQAAQLEWDKLKKIADDHNEMLKGGL